jgi:hypothetical protein
MSKAEEKSKQYREFREQCGIKDPIMLNEIEEAYYEGYHQAEKDLDISWVKEVSGVKELSRAKEEALKVYPPQSIAANYDTINRRDAFEYGYLKAEKDLELTWEDIDWIVGEAICNTPNNLGKEQICKEVLNRFKERKEK